MAEITPVKTFDYSSLDAATSQFVQQQTGEIRALMKRTAQGIIDIGQKLNEVKQRLGHGKFGLWLQSEFNLSKSAANKFMRVTKQFKLVNFTNVNIAPSALYELAASSVPEAARQEAITRAQAGEYITFTVAKKIKQKHKSKFTQPEKKKSDRSTNKANFTQQFNSPTVDASLSSKSPQKIIKPQSSKPTILDIIPQQQARQIRAKPGTKAPLIEPESWWQLGKEHLLYCGAPDSWQFQKQLPPQVSLSLAFPPNHNNWQNSISASVKSAVSLFTIYQDQDLTFLRTAIKNLLLLYTEEKDVVVFSFLSDPQLLLLAHQLGCCCLVAEPNTFLCEAIIATWKQTGAIVNRAS